MDQQEGSKKAHSNDPVPAANFFGSANDQRPFFFEVVEVAGGKKLDGMRLGPEVEVQVFPECFHAFGGTKLVTGFQGQQFIGGIFIKSGKKISAIAAGPGISR